MIVCNNIQEYTRRYREYTAVYKDIQEYTDSIQLRVSRSWKLLTSSVNLVTSGSCSVRTKFTISSVVYSPENTERPSSNWVKGRGRGESGGRRERGERRVEGGGRERRRERRKST